MEAGSRQEIASISYGAEDRFRVPYVVYCGEWQFMLRLYEVYKADTPPIRVAFEGKGVEVHSVRRARITRPLNGSYLGWRDYGG